MPKNTFYNLPSEKRERIILAARNEFIRAKDGNLVIKNIVLDANIPRGSFYQYFESKEDLIEFLIEINIKQKEKFFCKKLDMLNGDILQVFEEFFNKIILNNNEKRLETESRFLESTKDFYQKYLDDKRMPFCEQKKFNANILMNHIDKNKFKINTPEELSNILYIIMSITIKNVRDFQQNNQKELAIKSYKQNLDYLRYGILK